MRRLIPLMLGAVGGAAALCFCYCFDTPALAKNSLEPERVVERFFSPAGTFFDCRGGQPSCGDPERWLSFFAPDSPPAGYTCSSPDAPGMDPETGAVPGCACYSNTGVPNPRGLVGGCFSGLAEIGGFFRAFVPLLDSFSTRVIASADEGGTVLMQRVDSQTVGAAALAIFPGAKVGVTFPLQVMGRIDVNKGGKLTRWSDYFNVGDWERPSGILLTSP